MFKTILFISFLLFSTTNIGYCATIRELYEQAVDAYNTQQYDHAIDLYQQITKISPNFAPAYVGIGLSLRAKGGDTDEVLYYYRTATDMDPTNAAAFEQLGRLYYSLNRFDKAEKSFLKALSIDPNIVSAKLSLGWINLLGKSKPSTAIKYFKEVIRTNPTANTYLGLGMAYFANNNRVKALEMITQLHDMKEEDYAKRLETIVRENQKVALIPQTESPEPQQRETPYAPTTPTVNDPTPDEPTGIKVRLRGKLSEVD